MNPHPAVTMSAVSVALFATLVMTDTVRPTTWLWRLRKYFRKTSPQEALDLHERLAIASGRLPVPDPGNTIPQLSEGVVDVTSSPAAFSMPPVHPQRSAQPLSTSSPNAQLATMKPIDAPVPLATMASNTSDAPRQSVNPTGSFVIAHPVPSSGVLASSSGMASSGLSSPPGPLASLRPFVYRLPEESTVQVAPSSHGSSRFASLEDSDSDLDMDMDMDSDSDSSSTSSPSTDHSFKDFFPPFHLPSPPTTPPSSPGRSSVEENVVRGVVNEDGGGAYWTPFANWKHWDGRPSSPAPPFDSGARAAAVGPGLMIPSQPASSAHHAAAFNWM